MSKLEDQRTYALVGTGGCGKTSVAEMILFQAGAINRLGKSEEGTTTMDYEPEEMKRHGSIQPSVGNLTWKKNQHFLLDTPGDSNFIGDLSYLLMGVDGVVFVLDAVDGVRPLTKKLWKEVRKAGLSAVVFINKMDRDRADFPMAFEGLSSGLGMKPVLLSMPIGSQTDFRGRIDIMTGKAYLFEGDGKLKEIDIPADMAEEAAALRNANIENIAESDEVLMEKYLDTGELTPEEIRSALKQGARTGQLTPVCVGSALLNKGGIQLLETIQSLLPSPLDSPPYKGIDGSERAPSPDGPTTCFVFKTLNDPFTGHLSLMRVLSGSLQADSTLKNMATGETERISQPLMLQGKTHTPCKEPMGPGSIVAVAKLKSTATGATLCDEKAPFALPLPALPPRLITYALAPKEKGEEDKVFAAVAKLLEEDVNLKLGRSESGDILLSGMGQLHIEISVEKARRRYKAEIVLKAPTVPYKETIKGSAEVQGRHKKQSGGRGQFGDCWIKMEPQPRGAGYEFVDNIVGGVIPRQFIPAVDKGVQESAQRGFLAGFQVVDFKVSVYDGSYHSVDSSEMAFKMAGSIAFKKAMEMCKPILLEPFMLITVSVPDEHMGDIIGDLSSRRGKVLGSEAQGGVTEIRAHAPMSELLTYSQTLSSMTGGQGMFTMEFDHYEEAPPQVAEKVIAEHKKVEEE